MCTRCQQQYIIELTVAKSLSPKFKYYEPMIMIVEPILMFSVHRALQNSFLLVSFDFFQRRQITAGFPDSYQTTRWESGQIQQL